jgi:hypothetical protein
MECDLVTCYSRVGKKFKKIIILFVIQLEIIKESNRKMWYPGIVGMEKNSKKSLFFL